MMILLKQLETYKQGLEKVKKLRKLSKDLLNVLICFQPTCGGTAKIWLTLLLDQQYKFSVMKVFW